MLFQKFTLISSLFEKWRLGERGPVTEVCTPTFPRPETGRWRVADGTEICKMGNGTVGQCLWRVDCCDSVLETRLQHPASLDGWGARSLYSSRRVSVSASFPLPPTSHRRWMCCRRLDSREIENAWTAGDLKGFPGPSRTPFWKLFYVRRNVPPSLNPCKRDIPNTGDMLDCWSPVQSLSANQGPALWSGVGRTILFPSAPIFKFYPTFHSPYFHAQNLDMRMACSSHSGPIRVSIM